MQSGRETSERASTTTHPSTQFTQATDIDLPSPALCLSILSFLRATNVLGTLPSVQYLTCLLSCSRSARSLADLAQPPLARSTLCCSSLVLPSHSDSVRSSSLSRALEAVG